MAYNYIVFWWWLHQSFPVDQWSLKGLGKHHRMDKPDHHFSPLWVWPLVSMDFNDLLWCFYWFQWEFFITCKLIIHKNPSELPKELQEPTCSPSWTHYQHQVYMERLQVLDACWTFLNSTSDHAVTHNLSSWTHLHGKIIFLCAAKMTGKHGRRWSLIEDQKTGHQDAGYNKRIILSLLSQNLISLVIVW